jgi:hypothetical protein
MKEENIGEYFHGTVTDKNVFHCALIVELHVRANT